MRVVTLRDIVDFTTADARRCDDLDMSFSGASPLPDAQLDHISLCRSGLKNSDEILMQTSASLIVIDRDVVLPQGFDKPVLVSDNARLEFMRILDRFFAPKTNLGIHDRAIIDPSATIGKDVSIGAGATIGANVVIGNHVTIHDGVHIYPNVTMGDNVILHSGCVIGADGFGFERDDGGDLQKFPHIGGVVIGNDVEIMAQTHVARGTLGNTEIGAGTKIDAQCHIAHNVKIGARCLITAKVMIAGSVTIGDDVYIAPSASLINKVTIGDRAFIGMTAFVRKNVAADARFIGIQKK